jgi:hypothetical protein
MIDHLDDELTGKAKFYVIDIKSIEHLEEIGVMGLLNAALDD